MDQSELMSSEEKRNVAGEALASLGENPDAAATLGEEPKAENAEQEDPIQQRLARQAVKHKKEMREMQSRIDQMQHHLTQRAEPTINPSDLPEGSEDERIQKAVMMALRAKDDQERQAKEAEKMAHVHRQYGALQDHLDNASTKYDDFDDIVRSQDAPYSDAMRDAALLIPNAADVLYKLGKNRDELKRISNLHPLEQAKEMIKMSVALMSGNGGAPEAPRPIGQIKSNPVTSHGAITDQTPISELRNRMKKGWKL